MLLEQKSGSFNIAAAGNLYSDPLPLHGGARYWTFEINFTTGGVGTSPTWRMWGSVDGTNWPNTNCAGPYSPGTGQRRVVQSSGPAGIVALTTTIIPPENYGWAPWVRLEIGNPSANPIIGTYRLIAWD